VSGETLIQVEDLVLEYPDGTRALDGVRLDVREHEFIALIGQNGSGKTTLSKCLNGILRPTEGAVRIGDLDTRERGATKRIVTRVGYVFQNPDHQLFNNTVHKEIAYGPRNLGLSAEEVEERVREAAQVCGVKEALFEEHPFFLTKGLRQRVSIASILAMRPRVIIVDEPTTGQDRRQSVEVMNFLRALWERDGHTVIIITHEMPIVSEYARRCIVLSRGRVLMDGPTREVFASPDALAQAYVKPPQITRLAQALGAHGFRRDVLSVDELLEEWRRVTAPKAGA
jgi:energy-coupling factor transport system ATP-binding protein